MLRTIYLMDIAPTKHKESVSRDRLTSIMTPYGGGL